MQVVSGADVNPGEDTGLFLLFLNIVNIDFWSLSQFSYKLQHFKSKDWLKQIEKLTHLFLFLIIFLVKKSVLIYCSFLT